MSLHDDEPPPPDQAMADRLVNHLKDRVGRVTTHRASARQALPGTFSIQNETLRPNNR